MVCLFPRSLTPDLPHSPPFSFPFYPIIPHRAPASASRQTARASPWLARLARRHFFRTLTLTVVIVALVKDARSTGLCCCDRTGNMWTCLAHSPLPVNPALLQTHRPLYGCIARPDIAAVAGGAWDGMFVLIDNKRLWLSSLPSLSPVHAWTGRGTEGQVVAFCDSLS